MLYYFLIFAYFLVISLKWRNRPEATNNKYFAFGLLLLFVFFAFRVGFTPDYYGYELDVEGQTSLERHEDTEFGFIWLITFINSYRLLLVIQTILLCFCLFFVFTRHISNSNWWITIILLFLCPNFMLGMVSAFRSSFVVVAFIIALLIKDRYGILPSLALLLASCTIHTSGIILIPMLFISDKPLGPKVYRLVLLSAIILCVTAVLFANTINTLFNGAVAFFGFEDRFEDYQHLEIRNTVEIGKFTILRLAMLFYLFFETLSLTSKQEVCNVRYIKLSTVFFMLTLMPGIGMVTRFYSYFALPAFIGVSSVINQEKNPTKKTIYQLALVLYAIWEFYLLTDKYYYADSYGHYDNILF